MLIATDKTQDFCNHTKCKMIPKIRRKLSYEMYSSVPLDNVL